MPYAISDSIRLYGTNEPVEPPRILQAGPLSVEFEAGNLRYIRFHSREMIRAVSFVVRDKNWGTYAPQIANLDFHEEADSFRISYQATVGGEEQAFRFSAVIAGESNGSLSFSCKGTAASEFLTNRTGFVVLHPIESVAGAPCTVEHVDGTIEETRFPLLIDPVQPMSALRTITHEFLPGLKVTCRMEGDIFEMEDQRNWTDASYKTYVRPLALPWGYTLVNGSRHEQSVRLSFAGAFQPSRARPAEPATVRLGADLGTAMPPLGVALP